VPECITTKLSDDVHRIDDITERLTGLLSLDVDEAVGKDLPRRVDASGEAHCWPQGAVEARDVLADEMNVGRPPLLEALLILPVADRRDVVQQGVEPHVDGELLVERNADAPVLADPSDVDVAQFGLHQRQDLVATRLRL